MEAAYFGGALGVLGALVLAVLLPFFYHWFTSTKQAGSYVGTLEPPKDESTGGQENKSKSKKKFPPDRRNRDLKAVFDHRWLLTSLKGHTGNVLDMDFSSNGKYLASCADEFTTAKHCNDLLTFENSDDDSSGSQGSKVLVRTHRQRRNASKKKQEPNQYVSRAYGKLGLKDADLYHLFKAYLLGKDELRECGFPIENRKKPGEAYIRDTNGFNGNGVTAVSGDSILQKCCRCQKGFYVKDDGEYAAKEPCSYHWGKLKKQKKASSESSADAIPVFNCCDGAKDSEGCTEAQLHVRLGPTTGLLKGFAKTDPCHFVPKDKNYGVYAVDCEMCFTTKGLELVKVSLVRPDGTVTYNTLVKPANPVIDHNTRFSGITEKQLARASKSLEDVQRDLQKLVHAETILLGHSLENDLRALRLLHSNVVDTSIVFPHFYGLPYRRSLKSLVGSYLKKCIQMDVHNSVEDARSCMELMLWRLKKDMSFYKQ